MDTEFVEVTIAVATQDLPRFDRVVEECEAVGLRVSNKLAILGLITGQIERQATDKLRAVAGVAAVEESRPYQLPPPDSEVQ